MRRIKLTGNIGDDVHYVTVTLYDHKVVHANFTMLCDATHVITGEIN